MPGVRSICVGFLCICLTGAAWSTERPVSAPEIAENQNRTLAGQVENNVLRLNLELRRGIWHPGAADGRAIEVPSFAEEGKPPQAPGPLIRVTEGTELQISVHNLLPAPAFVHGLHKHPGKADDSIEVASGETKQLHFLAGEPGTYLYWAATSRAGIEARFSEEGLLSGALIVDAPGDKVPDRIFMIGAWAKDVFHPSFDALLSINGKSWPYTERLHAKVGEPEHWRVLNATIGEHPMHLHGFYFHVDAVGDGESNHRYEDAERRMVVTELVRSGHTMEMTWMPERAGNWMFHCHIVHHMMEGYKAPWNYGPDGPPTNSPHAASHDDAAMGMAQLVMGITVSDNRTGAAPVEVETAAAPVQMDLFVRRRNATAYSPAGPGFYLKGVSNDVGPVGPPLVVTRGQRTAISIHNELDEPTAIHWHGIEIESYYDGVPGWTGDVQHTTPYIAPGKSFVAYMTPPRAGTFIYHTHWHDVMQLTSGMYGALLVLDAGQKYDPATDKIFVLGRGGPNEMTAPLLLNGSAQPWVMVLLEGKTYRCRFINITPNDSLVDISMTMAGRPAQWRALAKDGADLPAPQATVRDAVQTISVGETYDFEFTPRQKGDYELRFCSKAGNVVTQIVRVVPANAGFSIFAEKH